MPRIRLLPFLAAILFVLAGASDAHAGQYTLSYDFSSGLAVARGVIHARLRSDSTDSARASGFA